VGRQHFRKRVIADFNLDWPDVTQPRELLLLPAEEVGGNSHVIPGRALAQTWNIRASAGRRRTRIRHFAREHVLINIKLICTVKVESSIHYWGHKSCARVRQRRE
jgi:hypothetical protein